MQNYGVASKISPSSRVYSTGICNSEYIGTLRRLRDAVRRKRPEKWTIIWFLLHENAPVHRSVIGQRFLNEEQCDNTGESTISPDLAPVNSYLFPRLKSAFKGRHFCDPTDIIRMRRKSWKGSHKVECIQHLNSRWQKGQLWSKCSLNDCSVSYFSEIKWFRGYCEATT
jgi:hypothetical protein